MHEEEMIPPSHLASEFYTWLWWLTETKGGNIGDLHLFVEGRLAFRGHSSTTLVSIFNGDEPTGIDAKTALLQDKPLHELRLHLVRDSADYVFTLKGPVMDLASVKLPHVLGDEGDSTNVVRMEALQELDRVRAKLFTLFTETRCHPQWGYIHSRITEWASER